MKLSAGVLLCATLVCFPGFGQKREYDFFPEFRAWMQQTRRQDRSATREQVLERYRVKLRGEGVAEAEITRRTNLIATSPGDLEADFWNRFFTEGTANLNTTPNAFLTEMVEGREAGVALDYGMGEGRNALYLARLGWQVYGFDPADKAVALAEKRAKALELTLNTKTVADDTYDFGKERFDLVLFSWTMPGKPEYVQKVADSLKPGGIVVMECGADWMGRNGMLRMFDALQIERYEIVSTKSDFFNRQEMSVLRMVARKPQ